jgi:hypothetical protein
VTSVHAKSKENQRVSEFSSDIHLKQTDRNQDFSYEMLNTQSTVEIYSESVKKGKGKVRA